MFCDEVKIKIKAGDGGAGIVSFRREIFVAKGGPDGGDGGNGGSVFIEMDPEISTLSNFRRTKLIKASDGKPGGRNKRHGKGGEDLVLKVPSGTLIYNTQTKELIADLTDKSQKITLVRGGKGGFGNAHFTSSTRQVPNFAEHGEPGEQKELKLELKLVADVGIIGLPNVGKSTLLSRISAAKPKIADYPFTTLVPNLGIVDVDGFSFTASDIPGLIKDAYKGKGLGDQFLRHIERCRLLIHIIDVNSQSLTEDYKIINNELKKFSPKLYKKPQIVVINKIDTIEKLKIKDQKSKLLKTIPSNQKLSAISAVSGKGIKELLFEIKKEILKIPKPKPEKEPIKVFRPFENLINVEKQGNIFVVAGEGIERIAQKTDFANDEAKARLHYILERKGVFKMAQKEGAEPGDSIKIAGKLIKIIHT